MVPSGWSRRKITEILDRVAKPVSPQENTKYREIGIRSHGKGIFYKDPATSLDLGNKRVFEVIPNSFVVNIVFAWEQAVAKTTENEIGFIASHRFPQFQPKNNSCDIDYLLYLFKTPKGKHLLGLASPGGAGRNKTLGQKEFEKLELLLPNANEQRKIAKILSTWDKAISTTESLIANSQQQKKALMQQLLTRKKRFMEFKKEWKESRIRDCAICMDNKRVPLNKEQRFNRKGQIPYWGANGILDYVNDYIFDETIVLIAEDGGYFNEFSTRPIANISYGKSWVNNHAHILKAKSNVTNNWLYYSLVHKNILAFINGGTRAKLNKSDMLLIPILLPSNKEQEKITSVLSAADQEIKTLKQKLTHLKQEKKALMQQLLTGKRRVKVDNETEAA